MLNLYKHLKVQTLVALAGVLPFVNIISIPGRQAAKPSRAIWRSWADEAEKSSQQSEGRVSWQAKDTIEGLLGANSVSTSLGPKRKHGPRSSSRMWDRTVAKTEGCWVGCACSQVYKETRPEISHFIFLTRETTKSPNRELPFMFTNETKRPHVGIHCDLSPHVNTTPTRYFSVPMTWSSSR